MKIGDTFSERTSGFPPHAAALTVLAMACGGDEARRTELDIPLVAIAEEVFALGGLEAPDWQQFVEFSDVRFDGAGNLVLLDRRRARVAVADPRGEFSHFVSRAGDGPGELRMVGGIAVLPDGRVVVSDLGHNAFLLFDESGAFVEQFSFGERSAPDPAAGRSGRSAVGLSVVATDVPVVLGVLSGTRLLTANRSARTLAIHALGEGASEFYRAYRLPADAAQGGDPPTGAAVEVRGLQGLSLPTGFMPPVLEFGPPLEAAVLADGRVVIVDSVGYRAKIVRDDGTIDAVLERPIDPVPATPEMREAARRRRRGGGDVVVMTTPRGMSGAEGEALSAFLTETMAAEMTFASEVPVVEGVAVDSEDRIWITRTGDDAVSRGPADVFTADGDYLGTLAADEFRVPDAFGPGGLMAYVEVNDLDVAVVRVLRLASLEPAATSPVSPGS